MDATAAIVTGASLVTCIVLVVFILARYNYLLKKTMIEKELPFELTKNRYRFLELGCTLLGLGAGLAVSSVFTAMGLSEDTTDLLAWGVILVFGGTGLVISHYIRRKQEGDA
jgi:uncharacterized protein YybS (DUF2232 family)